MKICFYHYRYPKPFNWETLLKTPVGGTQSALIYVAHCLNDLGLEVTVCNKSPSCSINGVRYQTIQNHDEFLSFENKESFDAVVYIGIDREFATQCVPLIKAPKKLMWAQNAWKNDPCYHNYDAIVCVSNSQRLEYAYLPIFEKTCFIHNGISPEHFPVSLLDQEKQEKAIYIGSISEGKGLHHILQSWQTIKDQAPNLQLLIAGSVAIHGVDSMGELGIATSEYENRFLKPYVLNSSGQIRNDIHFLGSVPHSELGQLVASCRVALVNPNRKNSIDNWRNNVETCCNCALEAQAAGTAVVAVDQGSLPEVILHRKTGLIVKSNNSSQYAKAISSLTSSETKAKEFGRAARKFIFEKFTYERQSNQWLKLLQNIINDELIPDDFKRNWYSEPLMKTSLKWMSRKTGAGLISRQVFDQYQDIRRNTKDSIKSLIK
jgi:glycosyltransferase involved in cell wall biosynthesis